jgi:hypothetical protein
VAGRKLTTKLCTNERKTVLSKDLMTETVIFTSRFGFCMIKYKTTQDDGAILRLSRPGFPWIEKEDEYLLEEKDYINEITTVPLNSKNVL